MAKSERFSLEKARGNFGPATGAKIIVDKETGVNYLFVVSGYAGGLTPLLDSDGKPVVTEKEESDK